MIKLGFVYTLAGLMFAGFAVYSALDDANRKHWGNAAFWALAALSFLAGDRLGDVGNGVGRLQCRQNAFGTGQQLEGFKSLAVGDGDVLHAAAIFPV